MESDPEIVPEDDLDDLPEQDDLREEADDARRASLRKYRGRHLAERRRSLLRELPLLVVIAFVTALVLKSFVVQAFYIPSASMEPTLRRDDRVIVEKISYRLGEPQRGDVIVFERDFVAPDAESADHPFWLDVWHDFKSLFGFPPSESQDFIKRVIAVGGDSVEGVDGRVLVNGEPVDEPYLADGTITTPFGPTEVPEGMLWVMGDNRSNSDDSRSFGPVPIERVVGHAVLLIWPPSDFSTL